MKRSILVMSLLFIALTSNTIFAYKWVQDGIDYYLQNDDVAICLCNEFYQENGNSYYFDADGKMCQGWYYNPQTKKVYFFNNIPGDPKIGAMIFGFNTIDGYLRYFNGDGTFVKAETEGTTIPLLDKYTVDAKGDIYLDGVLQFDGTQKRSDYYTISDFYTNPNLTNEAISVSKMMTWEKARDNVEFSDGIGAPIAR